MALLAWPAISDAQLTSTTPTVVGDASAARVSVLGILGTTTTTALADTGTLSGVNGARDASMVIGSVPGVGITFDSAVARASQVLGAAGSGSSVFSNLSINGTPIAVTGAPNQAVWIPGGQVIINEQTISPTGTAVVNALHVTVTGVADATIASASAGIS
jgi:hypothetical protein